MIKLNNTRLRGISLFSNVGVAEAYLEDIGIDILIANEIDSTRAKFYKHLYPKTDVIVGDITDELVRDEIVKKANKENIDILIATPPCQGMSKTGKRDPYDVRNQLVSYAIDVIKRVKPKFIMIENVPKQLTTKIEYEGERILIPEYIKKELSQEYYFNDETIVNASSYGVPQNRIRSIFLLTRKDTGIKWNHPKPDDKCMTLRDAIFDLPSLDPLVREIESRDLFPKYEEKKKEGLKISKWHYPPTHSIRHITWMMHTPTGKTAFENEIYYPQKDKGVKIKGRISTYKRFNWDKPAHTILQNNGVISSSVCVHPGRVISDDGTEEGRIYSDPRVLSIYELLIVTSLPKDWNIPDWATETFIRNVIGEGIPPLLVKRIFEELIEKL